MVQTEKLRKRFCKDNNLSVNVFEEPYFTSRLKLYGVLADYQDFVLMVTEKFSGDEELYFAHYNEIKDTIIDYIKNSETYNHLQNADMSELNYRGTVIKTDYPDRDVYKENLIGRSFISIDMRKANYSALVAYGLEFDVPFVSKKIGFNYSEFLKQFTDNLHILDSKYIRQVVFGNCNPKRQIHFEKCMMLNLLETLLSNDLFDLKDVFSIRADEILIDVTEFDLERIKAIESFILKRAHSVSQFPVSIEHFKLGRIYGTSGYIKAIEDDFEGTRIEVKCASSDELPFIYRYLKGERVQPDDLIFTYNGQLAQLLEAPELAIVFEKPSPSFDVAPKVDLITQ